MIRRYIAYREQGIFAKTMVAILTVQCDRMPRPGETARITTNRSKAKHRRRMIPFAGAPLLGAVAAGSIVTGLLELKAKPDVGSPFSWPALSGTERR